MVSDDQKRVLKEFAARGQSALVFSGAHPDTGITAVGGRSSDENKSIENRLQKLKDLLDKGLITQEEYDLKRRDLLKEL